MRLVDLRIPIALAALLVSSAVRAESPPAFVDRAAIAVCGDGCASWIAVGRDDAPSAALAQALVPETVSSFDQVGPELLDAIAGRIRTVSPAWLFLELGAGDPPELAAFFLKHASSTARAANPDARVVLVLPKGASESATLGALASTGAPPYVDLLAQPPGSSGSTPEETIALLAAGWPEGRILRPRGERSAVATYLAGIGAGAAGVLVECPEEECADWWGDAGSLAAIRRTIDDHALAPAPAATELQWMTLADPPSASRVVLEPRPTFVADDLATWIVVPPRSGTVVLAPTDRSETTATLVDPVDGRETALARRSIAATAPGKWKGGAFAIRSVSHPLFLRFDRPGHEGPGIEEEAAVEGAGTGLSAAEIVARLRTRQAAIAARRHTFVADDQTTLRFRVAGLAESFELEIRGPYFWNGPDDVEWAWQEMWLNGVRWRGEKVPELPLMEPEKVATPPLDLAFTEDYRYERLDDQELAEGEWAGRRAYVLRLEPRPEASGKSLYRGRAWVDQTTFDLLRTEVVQVAPGSDILSNQETTVYAKAPDGYPYPATVRSQTTLSTAGRVTLVERTVRLDPVRIDPPTFDAERETARASRSVMVKDTPHGLRYFEPVAGAPAGTRQIRTDLGRKRLFALAGVFYDDSLDYPLPLVGINYLDFDLFGKGLQTNVFFGGALLTATLSDPDLGGFDLSGSAFAIALSSNEDLYRSGKAVEDERVKTRPATFELHLGHPIGDFWKATLGYRFLYTKYGRADETAPDFVVPSSGPTHSLVAELDWDRWGWSAHGEWSRNRRSTWKPWGYLDQSTFDPDTRTYDTWSLRLAKEWSFSGFQRLRLGASYVDGRNLDRFSKHSFGFFGGTRVSGFKLGSVRTERTWIASATYGLSISELFRLDLTIDHARATDEAAGWKNEGFTGVALSGNTIGPWQTIVQYSIGVPLAGPESDGYVVYLVFLKLF